ncbi:hypothetical protein C6376_19760 [Streptomyces sp. P3]|uniref:hypothetical protein n=1 Tax=unclassified Streptomyces TaxID=2593676 RepID=UPI000D19D721|nr:hypothetical protein [Streptomyces sp. ID05-04B]AVV43335.1 hypothetical protein C6376_19760 [Streptomyces sp. P3]
MSSRQVTASVGSRPAGPLVTHHAHDEDGERDLTSDGGRTPTLHAKIDSAAAADRTTARGAGAGRIP